MQGLERGRRMKRPVTQPRDFHESVKRRRVATALHGEKPNLSAYRISLYRKGL